MFDQFEFVCNAASKNVISRDFKCIRTGIDYNIHHSWKYIIPNTAHTCSLKCFRWLEIDVFISNTHTDD